MTSWQAQPGQEADIATAENKRTLDEGCGHIVDGDVCWSAVFADLRDPLLSAIQKIIGDYDACQDILQDTFASAMEHYSEFGHRSRLTSWVWRIAINKSLNQLRQDKATAKRFAHPLNIDEHMIDDRVTQDRELEAKQLLANLPSVPGDIEDTYCYAKFAKGMSYQEIADACNKPIGSIKWRLHFEQRAIIADIEAMDAEAFGEGGGY